MNAIQLLKADHKTVEALFKRYEKAGEEAFKEKKEIAQNIVKELSIHAAIEEQLLYPAARAADERLNSDVLEALEEHHVAKWTLKEIDGMSPEDERFDAKVTVLMESIRHHVKEEETELFPKLQEIMGRAQLAAIGEALEQAKKAAPTHPHPMSPDTPPGNVITGVLAKILDTGRDAVRAVKERATQATQGATESAAKTARTKARDAAKSAKDAVTSATQTARTKAQDAAKSARTKAQDATQSARTKAQDAAKTAKDAVTSATQTARTKARGATKAAKDAVTSATQTAKETAKTVADGATRAASSARKSATRARAGH